MPSLPGRWAEPIQTPGVLRPAAWQAAPSGKGASPALMPPVPKPPTTHPALPRNRLSLAHSPGREGTQMEPGNLETHKAGTSEKCFLHTPLSDKYTIIHEKPLSPLCKWLSPLLRIHSPILFIYGTFRRGSSSLSFSWTHLGGLWGFFKLSRIDNYKLLVTIGLVHSLKESAYSSLSTSFHTAPATGDSLLPTSLQSWKSWQHYFQYGESQQEEAIPFGGKTHVFQEGQSYMRPLARKNISGNSNFISHSVTCRVCEPYDLLSLNRS